MVGTVLFTRHGETEDNVAMRLSTAPPGPSLTAVGRQQAAALANGLRDRELAAIYTSPLTRAQETAQIVRGDRSLPVIVDTAFRELSVGQREGRTDPGVFQEMDAVWAEWAKGNLDHEAGVGGETAREVLARGLAAVDRMRREYSDATVLVVAHSGVLQLLVPHLCDNLDNGYGVENWCRNCQLIEVQLKEESARCVNWAGVPLS
jgi:broad specificity phosphatase PhoE